jgi:c-di-GMP-binding flagellar brake protein YcgR
MSEASVSLERRQSSRMETSIPVRYRVLRDGGAEAVGTSSVTCDLSTGGLRFMANEFLSTACRLILELDIPALTQPVTAVSEVAWVQKANGEDAGQYRVGSRFMEITERDMGLITKYMKGR